MDPCPRRETHVISNVLPGSGPLAGIPVSLKDSIGVGGFDACIGYSSNTGKPYEKDGPMVKILRDAGMPDRPGTHVTCS